MNNREDILAPLLQEDDRVQYDGSDEGRVFNIAQSFAESSVGLIEALAQYRDRINDPVDENSADAMKEARYNVVYAWTVAQAAISKVAWGLRIEGDEAFKTAVAAAVEGNDDPDLGRY